MSSNLLSKVLVLSLLLSFSATGRTEDTSVFDVVTYHERIKVTARRVNVLTASVNHFFGKYGIPKEENHLEEFYGVARRYQNLEDSIVANGILAEKIIRLVEGGQNYDDDMLLVLVALLAASRNISPEVVVEQLLSSMESDLSLLEAQANVLIEVITRSK